MGLVVKAGKFGEVKIDLWQNVGDGLDRPFSGQP
jgi:hypothetical protein